MAYVKHKPCNITGKSSTDVSSGDMVKTSPTIVGVMEKMTPKYVVKKEDLTSTEVEPTISTELDLEIQKASDECITDEKMAAQEASYMRAATEEVTRNTNTVSIADLSKNSKKVDEYSSDISKVTVGVLKETTKDSELVNIGDDTYKLKADEAKKDTELIKGKEIRDQVMETEYGIMKLESMVSDEMPVHEERKNAVRDNRSIEDSYDQTINKVQGGKEIDTKIDKVGKPDSDVEIQGSHDLVIIDSLKDMSQERLGHREVEELKPLISDEEPVKEIMKLKVSNTSEVTDQLRGTSEEELVGLNITGSKSVLSDEGSEQNIMKVEKSEDTEVICDIKDTFLKKLEDVETQESKLFITGENPESGILKDAQTIDILKDTPQEKPGDMKVLESIANISGGKPDSSVLRDTMETSTEEIKRDLDDILEEGVKPVVTVQTSPKVREIQSENKPIVTTPTLSRRGLGGSQRLSRDQRPPPLDVSHIVFSSEEGTDEDFDTLGYIVTEPGDDAKPKQQFQEDSIYRINSSPDLLAEFSRQNDPSKLIPTVEVTEDVRDTLLAEVSPQAEAGIPGNETNQEVPQSAEIQSDSETVRTTKERGEADVQPEPQLHKVTKKTPQPSIPVEEVIEQPLMTFDSVTELQIPTLVHIEKYEDEVHKHKPMFRIESYDSADQGMEDIEALIEKANRELALEMERAGFKISDTDESPEEEEEEQDQDQEGDSKFHNPEQEPEVVVEHEVRPEGSDSKEQKKLRRVERRFERMASETLEREAAAEGSTAPEVELRREAEFEKMVSQLSTEEVAECQQEYSHLWDEGGLTPSEDWDSRDPDTPSGELEEESATASPPGTSA
jgi:hypothetical protein